MSEQIAGDGKVVSFTYTIVDEAGEIIEQSDLPISYVHGGKNDLFKKVERGLEGAAIGDSVEVSLTPEEGFGPYDQNLTFTDDLANVPPEFHHLGAEVEMTNDQGDSRNFVVTHIDGGKLTVDGNHPLAGKAIRFQIRVTAIRDASDEEMAGGVEPMAMPVLH
ncbi:MAG: FKBP-type peptidyl-prolyl cis-trans isomerase [Gammaproteobacteria bacterium]|nr:FKBP-type peptidyl-prolyl cis-trans isomerase [Gammaproteobacteria bacterium]